MNDLQPLIEQHQKGNLCVLLVDDDPNNTTELQSVLEDSGYEVEAAACAEEALQHLQRKAFSILLTDYSLPDDNGLNLAAQAKNRQSWLELILITGHDLLELKPLPQAADVKVDFLRKPVQVETLLQALEHATHRQRDRLQIPLLQPQAAPSPALPVEALSRTATTLPELWLPGEEALVANEIGWQAPLSWALLILVGFGGGWLSRGKLGTTWPAKVHKARIAVSRPRALPGIVLSSVPPNPEAKSLQP